MLLILEDNIDKLTVLINKLNPIQFIAFKNSDEAQTFMYTHSYTYTLYLDNEVHGSLKGSELLKWALETKSVHVKEVFITTFGPFAQKSMVELCQKHNIPYDIIKG